MNDTHAGEPDEVFLGPGGAWTGVQQLGDDGQAKGINRGLSEGLLSSLQMQHLVVLAGSGCSLEAGGPSMTDLWNTAVGEEPSEEATGVAAKVQYSLDGEGAKNIEALLSHIEAYLQIQEDEDVRGFLVNSKEVILRECSNFGDPNKLDAHRTFLHRLSRRRARDQRLRLFTTNYDLCFERAAAEIGAIVIDGFSFTAPRRYDPRFFGLDIVRRPARSEEVGSFLEGVFLLYKLHGSVNWTRSSDGSVSEVSTPDPDKACLIYPATGKYQQSFLQPHLESISQYLASIRESNTCVLVAGFGFNDDHLSEPLLAAASSNPHLRTLVVGPSVKDNVENPANRYWESLGRLNKSGEDVWFINAGFSAFAEMIPDLKALTPADALMKTIQGAARGGSA